MTQLKLSNIVQNINEFSERIVTKPEITKDIIDGVYNIKNELEDDFYSISDFIDMLLDKFEIVSKYLNYTLEEIEAIKQGIDKNRYEIFSKLFEVLSKQRVQEFKTNKTKFPVINLIDKYKDSTFEQEFNDYKSKIKGFTNINKLYRLKTGDIIKFIGGEKNNIYFVSKILGFNSEGQAYVLWDCYWFPIDLNKKLMQVL